VLKAREAISSTAVGRYLWRGMPQQRYLEMQYQGQRIRRSKKGDVVDLRRTTSISNYRLDANSPLDIVVFSRASALHIVEKMTKEFHIPTHQKISGRGTVGRLGEDAESSWRNTKLEAACRDAEGKCKQT